jgi:hypothetical protein
VLAAHEGRRIAGREALFDLFVDLAIEGAPGLVACRLGFSSRH